MKFAKGYEIERAEMESACYEFVRDYFNARPHLAQTTEQERLVAAGFEAGWRQKADMILEGK